MWRRTGISSAPTWNFHFNLMVKLHSSLWCKQIFNVISAMVTAEHFMCHTKTNFVILRYQTLSDSTSQSTPTVASCKDSVITSQTAPVLKPVCMMVYVFLLHYLATYVCALMRHHSWLLLACLPVSPNCQISFLCGITLNNFDELEIASAKAPSLSASCFHSTSLLCRASNAISHRVHDIRCCTVYWMFLAKETHT